MVFNIPSLSTILLLALAAVGSVGASPLDHPEVIPGPGMPSLASLGLTSKDLYESARVVETSKRDLFSRFDRVCNDNGCGRVPRADAQACINYLNNLGTQSCKVENGHRGSGSLMCTAGKARVWGRNFKGNGVVASYCRDVGAGGQNIINACTDGSGNVAGSDAAQGNGDLIVQIQGC